MNWKTTLSGVIFVGSLCSFLAAGIPGVNHPWLTAAQPWLLFVSAVSGFISHYFAKDKDVTGGKRIQ
jgi:hypothetical protein